MESGKEIKRTTGEKIFGFLEKFSPEKLSAKFVCLTIFLQKLRRNH